MCLLATLVDWALLAYFFLVFAAAVLSWMDPDPGHPIVRAVYRLTDPVFQRVRRALPRGQRIDFSPIVVGFLVLIARSLVVGALRSLGNC